MCQCCHTSVTVAVTVTKFDADMLTRVMFGSMTRGAETQAQARPPTPPAMAESAAVALTSPAVAPPFDAQISAKVRAYGESSCRHTRSKMI